MSAKYELLVDDTIKVVGETLFRIKSLVDFERKTGEIINKGDLGGYISKESNLSQSGNAWVSGDAMVRGDALVTGAAEVSGSVRISGDVEISGDAKIIGDVEISGFAKISGDSVVSNQSDFIVFKHWFEDIYFTYTKSNKMWSVDVYYDSGWMVVEYLEKIERDEEFSDYFAAYVELVEKMEELDKEYSN